MSKQKDTSLQLKLLDLFEKYDKDHNGVLSLTEVAEIMKTIKKGQAPTIQEATDCFNNMDTDRNGVIEKEEFVRALTHWLMV